MKNTERAAPADVLAAQARKDLACAVDMFNIARASYDLDLEQRAVAKYRALVDTMHAFGVPMSAYA